MFQERNLALAYAFMSIIQTSSYHPTQTSECAVPVVVMWAPRALLCKCLTFMRTCQCGSRSYQASKQLKITVTASFPAHFPSPPKLCAKFKQLRLRLEPSRFTPALLRFTCSGKRHARHCDWSKTMLGYAFGCEAQNPGYLASEQGFAIKVQLAVSCLKFVPFWRNENT